MIHSFLISLAFLSFAHGANLVRLFQSDFTEGTYRITTSGTYILMEDIEFNPNRNVEAPNSEGAYFPRRDQQDAYPGADRTPGPFRLGFFAAISIEADDVTLNLNGHTIKQHVEFYIQQRFYANIEIGKPFRDGQGPAKFGADRGSPFTNIVIHNGYLGLTSHHGIHGNDMGSVSILDLHIFDFEVGGIALNNYNDLTIRNCEIGPSFAHMPTNGIYSQARFDLLSFRHLLEGTLDGSDESIHFSYLSEPVLASKVVEDLIRGMDLFFAMSVKTFGNRELMKCPVESDGVGMGGMCMMDKVAETEEDMKLLQRAIDNFGAIHALPDGSAMYGIALNSIGVAVEWFGQSASTSTNAEISGVHIHDLNVHPDEILTYDATDGIIAKGAYGNIFDIASVLYMPGESIESEYVDWHSFDYQGSLLTDAQIVLAATGADGEEELVTLSITAEIIEWATGESSELPGDLICGADCMFHTNKGMVGIRIDNSVEVDLKDIVIERLNNFGHLGSGLCDDGTIESYQELSQFSLPDGEGYNGAHTRGMMFSHVKDVFLDGDISMNHLRSSNGDAFGIDTMFNDTEIYVTGDVVISGLHAGHTMSVHDLNDIENDPVPNSMGLVCGFHAREDVSVEIQGGSITSSDLSGPLMCETDLSAAS